MNDKILCVGGPLAGEYHDFEGNLRLQYKCTKTGGDYFYKRHEVGDIEVGALINGEEPSRVLAYGYEQHCKHVAERNSFEATFRNQMRHQKEVQDEFTASFLKSCKLVVIPNPFGEHQPITLSYGKHHLGHLNDQMEFVMTVVNCDHGSTEKQEMNRGRIGTPIVVIP